MARKNYTSASDDYMTPKEIYTELLKLTRNGIFDIDVCCSETHIPALKHFVNIVYDGLKEKWSGYCFMNPPFKYTKHWVEKAVKEVSNDFMTTVIAILPADRTETKYYQENILKNPNCVFAFIPGKVGFISPFNPEAEIIPSQKIMVAVFTQLPDTYMYLFNKQALFNTIAFKGGTK